MRRMLDVDIQKKIIRGRPNLRRKHACKRDMTQAGFKGDNATDGAGWRKKSKTNPMYRIFLMSCPKIYFRTYIMSPNRQAGCTRSHTGIQFLN